MRNPARRSMGSNTPRGSRAECWKTRSLRMKARAFCQNGAPARHTRPHMYKLHGFAQSGNAYKVALLLQALRQPWSPVHLPFADFAAGLPRSDAWRQDVNVMGEVPVLEVDGRKLTQSAAILRMLAERHGAYGGSDEDERQEVLRWMFFDNHKFTSYFAT